MTAEQLEELRKMAALPPDSPTSKVMASLARRVIAAEKLVEAAERDMAAWPRHMVEGTELCLAAAAYREASK